MTARSNVLGPKQPADEISLARLRRVLTEHFGSIPLLEHHLALLDGRGVQYAITTVPIWQNEVPETLFGVVRHVIRTQCAGDPPDPDVEAWLAAGRPDDPALGQAWDLINLGRYGTDALPAASRSRDPSPAVARLDELLRTWPDLPNFVTSYARVERFIDDTSIVLPPLTA